MKPYTYQQGEDYYFYHPIQSEFESLPNPILDERKKLAISYYFSHSQAFLDIKPGSSILDLGCAGGYVGNALKKELGRRVTGVDSFPLDQNWILINLLATT
jgi:2-polyprenyl-3-methyl-5-hydroxy-6-metoxy-1,4-benzoquinol methylase